MYLYSTIINYHFKLNQSYLNRIRTRFYGQKIDISVKFNNKLTYPGNWSVTSSGFSVYIERQYSH